MASIFSTQNLQTFLRRKYFRPPSRGPPGPPGRGPRDGRSPRESAGRASVRVSPAGASAAGAVVLVSSAINLLNNLSRRCHAKGGTGVLARTTPNRPFRRCRCRSRLAARFADCLDLVETLLLLVDANRQELDDRFSDAQTALQFMNESASALDGQQYVHTILELADLVGQAALAHAFHVPHRATRGGYLVFQRGNDFVQFFVHHVGANDEHQLISTIHSCLQTLCGATGDDAHASIPAATLSLPRPACD